MKRLKEIIREDEEDFKVVLARQKKRAQDEKDLEGRLTKHYSRLGGLGGTLRNYTNYSGGINSYLWNKHKNTDEHKNASADHHETMNSHIEAMDSALKVHKTPEPLTLYSKSRHDPRNLMDKDNIVHHPAYLSTSIQKNVPEHNYRDRNITRTNDGRNEHNFYKINVPKDHPGAYIQDAHSIDKYAKEFVLPRGTKLKYKSTKTDEDNINIIHHHELDAI